MKLFKYVYTDYYREDIEVFLCKTQTFEEACHKFSKMTTVFEIDCVEEVEFSDENTSILEI